MRGVCLQGRQMKLQNSSSSTTSNLNVKLIILVLLADTNTIQNFVFNFSLAIIVCTLVTDRAPSAIPGSRPFKHNEYDGRPTPLPHMMGALSSQAVARNAIWGYLLKVLASDTGGSSRSLRTHTMIPTRSNHRFLSVS